MFLSWELHVTSGSGQHSKCPPSPTQAAVLCLCVPGNWRDADAESTTHTSCSCVAVAMLSNDSTEMQSDCHMIELVHAGEW